MFPKCQEAIVKYVLCKQVQQFTDPFQFAYTSNRSVEDATLCLTDYILRFLDRPNRPGLKHFVKMSFVDFCSAFNTIKPHIMMKNLASMNVNVNLILWMKEFRTGRPQFEIFLNTKSEIIVTNTGAPQESVLSPIQFSLYTSNCRSNTKNCQILNMQRTLLWKVNVQTTTSVTVMK